jgi:S1-C subfamily serine protease
MSKLRSFSIVFLSGVAVTMIALVVLMAVGALPVRTAQTTTAERTATPSPKTVAATTGPSGSLTPAEIYTKYSSGVVEVLATFSATAGQSFFGPQPSASEALGSGFVVSSEGYILTNAHVVADNQRRANAVTVVFKGENQTTRRVAATIVGVDNTSDVALLKVNPKDAPALDPLPLGDSDAVQVGEPVVAIGNPLGYDFSLTAGIVSATDRSLQSPNGSIISNGIQTDAAINSGNSGGPLIDSSGAVIGINEQIASTTGSNSGLGFAVPINTAVKVMEQLKSGGTVKYAWLGVQGQTLTEDIARALKIDAKQGVLVAQVVDNSPADKVGLRGGSRQQTIQGQVYLTGGDVILSIDGTRLTSMEQLARIIGQHRPGDSVLLRVLSGSAAKEVRITLAERPDNF